MTRSLVTIGDLSDQEILRVLDGAKAFDTGAAAQGRLQGRAICTAFFEPSTRTRLSFEAAAHRLGAHVIGFADAASTSTSKGEEPEDTARVLGGYADLIVLRSRAPGAAAKAAAVAGVPVVNAGDGAGEHPTQTLVDLYTIWRNLGRLEGLRVAVVGDLRYGRTVHSLVPALRRFGSTVVGVPASGLDLPDELGPLPTCTLEEAAADCDVVYMTRTQRERHPEALPEDLLRLDASLLERTSSRAVVLHPLPRRDELARDVDPLPAAKYFEQARNGVPVRMAILAFLLEDGS